MSKELKNILLDIMKRKGIKIPKLSKEIGIPKDRIYKWYQEGTNPKPEDALTLEKWINDNKGDFIATDGSKLIIGEAKFPNNEKDTKIAALESELIKMKLDKLETNLNEVLSNQKVMMALMTTAMNNAIEYYSENNPAKAAELKGKTRSRIHAATKKGV